MAPTWLFYLFARGSDVEICLTTSSDVVPLSTVIHGKPALRLLFCPHLAAGASRVRADDGVCVARSALSVDLPLGRALLRRERHTEQRNRRGGDSLRRFSGKPG